MYEKYLALMYIFIKYDSKSNHNVGEWFEFIS